MSGVNGGIDYDIDLSQLSPELSRRIKYVQGGPDSPTELISAAEEIASSRVPATLPVLVDMLGFNNPVAANIAVDALVAAGSKSIPYLLEGVAAFNYSVNAYALRALGRIGDASALDVCLKCAEKGPIPNVRRAACKALAGLVLDEDEDARKVHLCLVELVENEKDWSVRYAAIAALEAFCYDSRLPREQLERGRNVLDKIASGEDDDPTVVARAVIAIENSSAKVLESII